LTQLFLATGEAAERLKVGRSQLQKLFSYLPYLYITKRETRLFPTLYIDAYAAYLQREGLKATIGSARAFGHTDEARLQFQQQLESRFAFTAAEVASMFCVSRMAITNWHQGGVFTPLRQTVRPKRDRGKGKKTILLIGRDELRRACEWRVPNF